MVSLWATLFDLAYVMKDLIYILLIRLIIWLVMFGNCVCSVIGCLPYLICPLTSLYLVQNIPLTFQEEQKKSTKIFTHFQQIHQQSSIFPIFSPKNNANIGINSWNSTDLAGILLMRWEKFHRHVGGIYHQIQTGPLKPIR